MSGVVVNKKLDFQVSFECPFCQRKFTRKIECKNGKSDELDTTCVCGANLCYHITLDWNFAERLAGVD